MKNNILDGIIYCGEWILFVIVNSFYMNLFLLPLYLFYLGVSELKYPLFNIAFFILFSFGFKGLLYCTNKAILNNFPRIDLQFFKYFKDFKNHVILSFIFGFLFFSIDLYFKLFNFKFLFLQIILNLYCIVLYINTMYISAIFEKKGILDTIRSSLVLTVVYPFQTVVLLLLLYICSRILVWYQVISYFVIINIFVLILCIIYKPILNKKVKKERK